MSDNNETQYLDEASAVDTLRPGSMPANIPDSKAAMLAYVMQVAGGMSKDDLNGFAQSLAQIGHEADQVPADADSNRATIAAKGAMKESIDEMFIDENLSEEFKQKASTLFEAAVHARLVIESANIQEAYEEILVEQTAEIVEAVTTKVDEYLDYVVEKWMEENEVAIESALKAEAMESFIEGLKTLFQEHYIEIPDDKVDVLEELGNQVEDLEAKLNESINETIELRKQLAEASMEQIFADMTEGLAATQIEKFRTLAEGVSFEGDLHDFANKLSVIKESFLGGKKPTTGMIMEESPSRDINELHDVVPESGVMSVYTQAISRTVKKQ
jgi:chemotaxis regulatin CheY-phosphate phosphatase CheZ